MPTCSEARRETINNKFRNIWDAIENTPEEAENMRLRSRLMMALEDRITQKGMTKAAAALALGATQTQISYLMKGRIDLFDLDCLVNMANSAGLSINLTIDHAESTPPEPGS